MVNSLLSRSRLGPGHLTLVRFMHAANVTSNSREAAESMEDRFMAARLYLDGSTG